MATKADKLSTQAYFKEARAWETSKTVASDRSRRLAWYVASGATVVAVLMSASTALLAMRQPDPPVVIRVNDTTGAVDVVSRLKGGDATYDEVTRKYWSELYVRDREGYSRELAEDFYNTVGLMSNAGEQKRYAEFFSPKNPMSPLNVYGDVAKVRILIKGSSFIKWNVLLVRYSKLVDRAGADRPEVTHWAATVVYRFSGAPMSEKDRPHQPARVPGPRIPSRSGRRFRRTGHRSCTGSSCASAAKQCRRAARANSWSSAGNRTRHERRSDPMRRALLLAILVPALALSEVVPPRGAVDPRVRIVDYNPADVVRLVTFFGVSTHVQFGAGEVIRDVAVGDEQAWTLVSRGGNLYVKPKAQNADTNLTVATDKRVYQFALTVGHRSERDPTAWSDPNLIFSLSFRYPDEEAAKRVAAAAAQVQANNGADRNARMKALLAEAKHAGGNDDYWVAGSPEISPTAARDDGRFIYLSFSNNRDMPAVFAVEEDGSESLVNTSVDANTIVVQRMVRRLALRKGSASICIVNKSFDFDSGRDNASGTIAPDVQRVLKGSQQ